MYPIKADKIRTTSAYGIVRTYTVNGKKYTDIHTGIDLVPDPSKKDAEIVSIADGIVTSVSKTGKKGGTACYVRIKHDNGLYSLYYHLKSKSIKVSKGNKVSKGQVIGIIGDTGLATGVHLHFQIDKGSSATLIDPTDFAYGKKELVDNSKSVKKLHLPKSVTRWRVYPLGVPAHVGNECGCLRPSKFGGLDYDIIKMVSNNVAIIKTRDFGVVQIYVSKETGAVISDS